MLRVLLALAVLAPAQVLACSYARPFLDALTPKDGAGQVPLNAEIKLIACESGVSWTFVDAAGVEVPVTRSTRGPLTILRPMAPLQPFTRYTVTVTGADETAASTFVTGERLDEAAPVLAGQPSVMAFNNKHEPFPSSCGKGESFWFTWPTLSDDSTPAGELILEARVGETSDTLSAEPVIATQTGTLALGRPVCGGYSTLDKSSVVLSARAVDWAGNVSEFTTHPVKNACGCSAGGPGLLVAALGLLARRVRAASRRAPMARP